VHPATKWRISGALALVPLLFPIIFLLPALSGRSVPSFRDQSDFFVPSHRYTAQRIARRELPLWNALAGNGETWIGNGQNEIFYPPALLFLLHNLALACGLFCLFHYSISYLFAFLFLRERASTLPAAVTGASLFSFAALAVSLSAYWNHFAGMVWIPAVAAAAHRGLRTRKQRAAFAAALGLALLAGSPESAALGILLSAFVFATERRRDRKAKVEDWTVQVRRWPAWAGAVLGGVALGAVELAPLIDTLLRSEPRAGGAGALQLRQLVSFIRSPSTYPWAWLPTGASYVQSLYVSLPLLILAIVAFFLARRAADRYGWLLLTLAAMALSFARFSFPFRYPAKLLIVALLGLAVLVAEGVDALRFETKRRFLPASLILAGTAAAEVFWTAAGRGERLTLLAGGVLLAGAAFGSADFRGVMAALGAAAIALHLAVSAAPLVRFVPLAAFEKPPLWARGKVLTSPDELLSVWATAALPNEEQSVRRQIDSLEGYSNLPFGIAKATTGSALPSTESRRFMNHLVGRTDFLGPAIVSGSKEIRFPRGDQLAHVIVPKTLSGAAFFSAAGVEPDFRVALLRAMSPGFDPLKTLLVGEKLVGAPPPGAVTRGIAVGSLISEKPERLEYKVDVSDAVWMYRAQSWDPWWIATIDGKRTPIVRANGVFSAIVVPKGGHRVVWQYRPLPFYAGAAISAVGLLVLLFWSLAGEPIVRTKRW
jgi:hypothetical protein